MENYDLLEKKLNLIMKVLAVLLEENPNYKMCSSCGDYSKEYKLLKQLEEESSD